MHFVGDQLHGYESRLTSDIYPADYGWARAEINPEKEKFSTVPDKDMSGC